MAIELDPRSLPRIWVVRVEEEPPTVYGTLGGHEIPLAASLPTVRYEVHVGPHSFPVAMADMTKFGDWVRIAAHIPDASILSPGLRGRSGVLYIQETYSSSDASPAKVLTHTSYFFHPDPGPEPALHFPHRLLTVAAANCFIRDLRMYLYRYFCK